MCCSAWQRWNARGQKKSSNRVAGILPACNEGVSPSYPERTTDAGKMPATQQLGQQPSYLSTDLHVLLLVLLLAALPAAAHAETITAIGGVEFEGTIRELDRDGVLHATTASGAPRSVPAEDIISIDFGNKPVPEATRLPREVFFSNGDRIRAAITDAESVPRDLRDLDKALEKGQKVTIKSPHIGTLTARLDDFYAFVQHDKAGELGKRGGFVDREAGQTRQDWVWLANGDVQKGRIEGFLKNEHGNIDLFYVVGARRFRVGMFGVVALRFQQYLPPEKVIPPELAGVVTLVDGSVISGKVIEFTRATVLLRVASGETLRIATSEALSMTFRNGRLVYLSPLMVQTAKTPTGEEIVVRDLSPVERLDLTPSAVRCVPYFSRPFVPQKDASYGGNRIALGDRVFPRGIGTHSFSEMTYDLGGRFERFEATIGIDAEVGRRGDAVFRVVVDGKDVLEDGRMRGGDRPRSVSVPLEGARSLTLIVDYGGDFDIADHANWAGACVIKARPAQVEQGEAKSAGVNEK